MLADADHSDRASRWLNDLQAHAVTAPLRPRDPLLLEHGSRVVGSIEALLAARMARGGLPVRAAETGWQVLGPPDESLARVAHWLSEQHLAGRWRHELLPVVDAQGQVCARIERAAVRPLGITTHAVHLVGHAAGGQVWVQQRALDKATDPGLWDTMMGGLRAADESVQDTLARETWEEAGLHLDALKALRSLGRLTVSRPVSEGYMVEHIDLFEADIPAALAPTNQDGEVARFECLAPEALVQRLLEGRFTLEAALILVQWMQGRGLWVGSAPG